MSEHSTLSLILTVNKKCLGACVCGFLAWGFWQMGTGDWVALRLFAANFAGGAIFLALQALWYALKLVGGAFRFTRFKRKGATPKADPMAKAADLRKRGLTG